MRQATLVALATLSALAFTLGPRRSAGDELQAKLAELRALDRGSAWPAMTAVAIGARLGHDPALCTAFVRTRLRFEPYAGILRGSDGVLASGGGNSAELCHLLRDMLTREGGPKLRFAWATLGEETAAKLVLDAGKAPPARAAMLSTGELPAADGPATAADRIAPRAALARQELADARADQEGLRTFVRDGGTDVAEALAAARAHAWLQVERDGAWVSFDPASLLSLPAEGVSVGEDLPDAAHTVHVRVEVERSSGGALRRELLCETEWPTPGLFGRAIDIVLASETLVLDGMIDGDRRPQAITAQAKEFKSFGCLLGLTGAQPVPGRAFDLTGRPKAPAAQPLAVDPFRRLGRGSPTPEPSELTGVFATFALRSPGREPKVVERALLDRVGAAARRAGKAEIAPGWKDPSRVALALLQRHRALVPTGVCGLPQMARAALTAVVERTCLQDAMALRHGTFKGRIGDALASLPDLPLELCQLSDTALAWTAASLAGDGICFFARPNLVLLSEMLDLAGSDRLVERTVVDLAVHGVAALGVPRAAFEARAFHGFVGSELEGRVMRGTTHFAAQVLRTAVAQGTALRLLEAPGDADALEIDPDARAVLTAELAAGARALAPAKAVAIDGQNRFAWWRLAADGSVLAVGHDGRGQGTSEGVFVLKEISIPMVKRCMKFVQCFNAAVAGGGSMREAGGACLSEVIQDVVKDSLDKAIDRFVKDPLTSQVGAARAQMLGADYEKLYQQAQAAWGRFQQAQAALDDPLSQIPGYSEVSDAARSAVGGGAEIGSAMGGRLFLLLTMGRDIAEYASKL